MQTEKELTRAKILSVAEKLFLRDGFLKVSMRDIAAGSGVSVANIYNYFKGKDDIFRAIVRPAVHDFEAMLHEHHGHSGMDITDMSKDSYFTYVVDEYVNFIQSHRHRLRILLTKAQGSSFENYRNEFTERASALVREYFCEMKRRHPELHCDVSDMSLRLHTIWIFAMFEELISCDVSQEELKKAVTEYLTIEIAGWRELMKI